LLSPRAELVRVDGEKLGKIAKAKSVTTSRKGSDAMRGQQINRVSGKVLIVLSLTALLAVLSGYTQPPQPDEGAAAHIFQLSLVALVPMILLFLATADWKQPLRSARPLTLPAAALFLAFGALYYLEHYR
jgi:prepilin signal peptidase PulO-like enzyme (type II secretory pathway)